MAGSGTSFEVVYLRFRIEFTFEIGTSPQTPSVETEPAGAAAADDAVAPADPPAGPDDPAVVPEPGEPSEQALKETATASRGSASRRRGRAMERPFEEVRPSSAAPVTDA
jgi:hypothetical protein